MISRAVLGLAAVGVLAASDLTAASAPVLDRDDPQEVAEAWLALVDEGEYARSWEEAAEMFRGQVPRDQWVAQMNQGRAPAGEVESREFVSGEEMTDPPGAPAGSYMQLRFRSTFSVFGPATEVVVLYADGDRGWRVAGYFVQP